MVQKNLVFLVNDSQDSREIARELELEARRLSDYSMVENEFPILILGSGEEHRDSHHLSMKVGEYLAKKAQKFSKLNIDAHPDICYESVELSCETHMGTSLETIHNLKKAIFTGYQKLFVDPIASYLNARFAKEMVFGQGIGVLDSISGANLHVTIDLDVLKDCKFCSGHFERGYAYVVAGIDKATDPYPGPNLDELADGLKSLVV